MSSRRQSALAKVKEELLFEHISPNYPSSSYSEREREREREGEGEGEGGKGRGEFLQSSAESVLLIESSQVELAEHTVVGFGQVLAACSHR